MSAVVLLALAGCSSNLLDTLNPLKSKEDESTPGTIGFVEGFLGGVVADEPRAALTGRDVLSAGGTAADAAVAVSLVLSVTLPSSAGLGGGGVCVVHDARSKRTEALDFMPALARRAGTSSPAAVPGLVRGLAALHAKYGRLQWAQLVAPAEKVARFGRPASRALVRDLTAAQPMLAANPELRKIFSAGTGKGILAIREGELLRQVDLSSVLGRLRARGGGDFYAGLIARQLAAAGLDIEDLRTYAVRWLPTVKVPFIRETNFHFPVGPGPSGILAAQMTALLVRDGTWEKASPAARAHLMAEATGRSFADRGRWLLGDGSTGAAPETLVAKDSLDRLMTGYRADRHGAWGPAGPASAEAPSPGAGTGFVVVDRRGSAVACALTLNGPFGVGRVAAGTGIVLARPPGPNGQGPDSLAVTLLVSDLFNTFYYGSATAGGPSAPSVLVNVLTRTFLGAQGETLSAALAAKRIHNGGAPDVTFYEQGLDDGVVKTLAGMGHQVRPAPAIGLVNAIHCPTGIPNKDSVLCASQSDPRGFGLAVGNE